MTVMAALELLVTNNDTRLWYSHICAEKGR